MTRIEQEQLALRPQITPAKLAQMLAVIRDPGVRVQVEQRLTGWLVAEELQPPTSAK